MVLLLVIVLVSVLGGGGGASNSGRCLDDLAAYLPKSSKIVYGSDLVQARKAGYTDDGSLEDLGNSQRKTGTIPDALTQQFRYGRLISAEDFKAQTGVTSNDIACSLSSLDRSVMTGSFDVAEVNGSSAANDGRLAASKDQLGLIVGSADANPEQFLEPRDDDGLASNDDVIAVIESLRKDESYSLLVQAGRDRAKSKARSAGFGVADGEGDDRALVVAWKFGSDDAAAAGRTQVVERVNDILRGTTSISADDLEVDGSLVRAVIPTRKAPELLISVLSQGRLLIPDE